MTGICARISSVVITQDPDAAVQPQQAASITSMESNTANERLLVSQPSRKLSVAINLLSERNWPILLKLKDLACILQAADSINDNLLWMLIANGLGYDF